MGGCALVFFLARYFLGDWTRRNVIAKSTMLAAIFRAVEREGFKMVIITRFAPVPTGAKNYGLVHFQPTFSYVFQQFCISKQTFFCLQAAGTTVSFGTIFIASGLAGLPYSALAVYLHFFRKSKITSQKYVETAKFL